MTTITSGTRNEGTPGCFGYYNNNESKCRFCGSSRDCYTKKFPPKQQARRKSATEIAADILRRRDNA